VTRLVPRTGRGVQSSLRRALVGSVAPLARPLGRLHALAAVALAAAGCDSVAPLDLRGDPVATFEAVLSEARAPEDGPVALGIFWLPAGAAATDLARWTEDDRPGVAVALDAPLTLRLFDAPPAELLAGRRWLLGAVVAFVDTDGDGHRGPGERLVGGARRDYVLYALTDLPKADGPFRRDISAGFHAVRTSDLACPVRLTEPPGSCGERLGAACASDADCGPDGSCHTRIAGRDVPGGVCAVSTTCASRRVAWGGVVSGENVVVAGCERDGDCRTGDGHACVELDFGYFGCLPPLERVCDAPVGAPCAGDGDCGADGRCETSSPIYGALPGGYCVVPEAAACRPLNGRPSPLRAGEEPWLRECLTDAECRVAEGYLCDRRPYRSVCVPQTAGSCETAGAACTGDADCGQSAVCADETSAFGPLPGGMCLVAHGAGGCVWETAGWSTWRDDGLYYRSGSCGSDADCRTDAGYWCNHGAETCVPPPSGACAVPIGDACVSDDDCGTGGTCVTAVEDDGAAVALPGGFCRAGPDAGCALADGVYDAAYGQLYLLARCDGDDTCRDGWACDPWLGGCLPPRPIDVRVTENPWFEVPICR